MTESTIEQVRAARAYKNDFTSLFYVVYNTITGAYVTSFRSAIDATKYTAGKKELYTIDISNSIHLPRDIYLQLTPYAQLDFFMDGYLSDSITERHKALRLAVLSRENKHTDCLK